MDERRNTSLERHAQSIGIALIIGSIGFSASYFFKDNAEKATILAQLTVLNTQVAEMRAEVRAMQSLYATKEVVVDVEKRVRDLERKVR